MRLAVEILLSSMEGWREQIAQALQSPNPKPTMRHLDASMAQVELALRYVIDRENEKTER
jgi:hypothetical protein